MKIEYPPLAKAAKVGGEVVVDLLINDDGRVVYSRPIRGHPLLAPYVAKALCQKTFSKGLGARTGPKWFCFDPSLVDYSANEKEWVEKLYEKNVDYSKFAASPELAPTVATYFEKNPLKKILPICHNNCPVVKITARLLYPEEAEEKKISGKVAIHILVNEKGEVIYARVLTGHPLLNEAAIEAAKKTKFYTSEEKRQGVMHFSFRYGCTLIPPSRANMVR